MERELAAQEVHAYQIAMIEGQYAHVIVDQQGIDAVVKVYGPGNSLVCKVDRPNSSRGRESVSFVAKTTGAYALRIQSLDKAAPPGRYTIKITEVRVAIPRDESRMAAEKAVTEGEQLRAEKTARTFLLAIEKFEQAVALWRALDDPYEEAIALYGIGLTYRSIGENQKATNYFTKAILIMRRLDDPYGEAITQTGLAWAYLYLGENQKALDNFSHALELRRSINDKRGEAMTLHGIGWIYALMNENEKALEIFSKALSIRESLNDREGEALTLVGIGKIYNAQGRKKESLDSLNRALSLSREVGDHYGEANALSTIGWVFGSSGDYKRALDNFNQALPLRRAVGDRSGEANTLFSIGEVEQQTGNLLNARNDMEVALNIIESLGTLGTSQELRISYFASVQNYYQLYIDLLQRLDQLYPNRGYAAVAFEASERARARSLLDILAEIQVDIRQDADPALMEKERLVQQQLNVAAERQRRLINGKHTEEQIATAAQQVESLTSEYHDVEAQIRASSPRFAALTRPRPLSLKEIQQQVLDDKTLLLEYALGEERSYLWAVTSTEMESFQLPKREEIESSARRLYACITARNRRIPNETTEQRQVRLAREDSEYPVAAGTLSRMLLGPIEPRLGTKRLLIVAQGALQFIPFGALPKPLRANESSRSVRALALDHEIVNMVSASTLAVLRRETSCRKPAPKTIAILADPVFSKYDERVRPISSSSDGRLYETAVASGKPDVATILQTDNDDASDQDFTERLPRLFATRWEAEQIFSLVPANEGLQAIDFNADRELVLSGKLAQYRILHFATHSLINNTHPELSGVVLSLSDKWGRDMEGFLVAHEIYNLKLSAELVVLSGCRTGQGKDVKGEGLIGLTRGFMYAGTPRVMASLWSVNDRAAAEMMVRFYRKMLGPEKESAVAALRSAQVEMLKDKRWQLPYFWAAFVMQGDWL